MRNKALKNNRNEDIRNAYAKKAAINLNGVALYRHTAILEMLSKKFYLAPRTIENIVSQDPEPDNQYKMFEDENTGSQANP